MKNIYLKFSTIALILFMVMLSQDLIISGNQTNYSPINDNSSIIDDFVVLGLTNKAEQLYKVSGSIFKTFTFGFFPLESNGSYIYIYIPLERLSLKEVVINEKQYNTRLISKNGYISKFYIDYNLSFNENVKLTLSSYRFDGENYNTIEELYLRIDNNKNFNFTSIKQNTFLADGFLNRFTIDLRTNSEANKDLFLGKTLLYFDVEKLHDRYFDLYFYSFDMIDLDRGIAFEPNEIISAKLGYTEVKYKFLEKNQFAFAFRGGIKNTGITEDYIFENSEITRNEKIEFVTKTEIETKNCNLTIFKKNCKTYEYPSLFKHSEIVEDDETDEIVSTLINSKFTYSVLVGNQSGYRFTENSLNLPIAITGLVGGLILNAVDFDYEQTILENVSLLQITYIEDGNEIAVNLDSIARENLSRIYINDINKTNFGITLEEYRDFIIWTVIGVTSLIILLVIIKR